MFIEHIIEGGKLIIRSDTGQEHIYTLADLNEIKKEVDRLIEEQTAAVEKIIDLILQCQACLLE